MHGQAAIAQDLAKAEELFKYALEAAQGEDERAAAIRGLFGLGSVYQNGQEAMHGQAAIAQDLAKAEELFKYALEKATGEEERAAAIGRLLDLGVYQNGQEAMHGQAAIPQNLSKAGELYALAKGYGSEEATELLRRLSQEWYRWSCTKSSKSRR